MRQALADRAGDVDAFIAFEQAVSPEQPDRVRIAERLLGANRAPEALDWIRRPQKRGPVVVTREALLTGHFDHDAPERARQAVEIRILDSLGQTEAAHGLCINIPAEKHVHYMQPAVGHYGVFNGSRFRSEIVPRIVDFITSYGRASRPAKARETRKAKS